MGSHVADLKIKIKCFLVTLIHISFIFTVQYPLNDRIVMFDRKLRNILSDYPSVSIHIYSDFNIHHKEFSSPLKENQQSSQILS